IPSLPETVSISRRRTPGYGVPGESVRWRAQTRGVLGSLFVRVPIYDVTALARAVDLLSYVQQSIFVVGLCRGSRFHGSRLEILRVVGPFRAIVGDLFFYLDWRELGRVRLTLGVGFVG